MLFPISHGLTWTWELPGNAPNSQSFSFRRTRARHRGWPITGENKLADLVSSGVVGRAGQRLHGLVPSPMLGRHESNNCHHDWIWLESVRTLSLDFRPSPVFSFFWHVSYVELWFWVFPGGRGLYRFLAWFPSRSDPPEHGSLRSSWWNYGNMAWPAPCFDVK